MGCQNTAPYWQLKLRYIFPWFLEMKYVFIDSFEGDTEECNFADSVPIFPSPLLTFVFVSGLLTANMLLPAGDSDD